MSSRSPIKHEKILLPVTHCELTFTVTCCGVGVEESVTVTVAPCISSKHGRQPEFNMVVVRKSLRSVNISIPVPEQTL